MLQKRALLPQNRAGITYRMTVGRSPKHPNYVFGFSTKESVAAETYGDLQPRTLRSGGKEVTLVSFTVGYNTTKPPLWVLSLEVKDEVTGTVRVEYKDVVLEGALAYNDIYKGYYASFEYSEGNGNPAVVKMYEYLKGSVGQTIDITLIGGGVNRRLRRVFLYALRCILPLRKGNAKGLELNTQGFLRSLFF